MTARTHFPWRFDGSGRTQGDDHPTWVRGLVEQVLFTAPGERAMRPTLGSGLAELVFAPNSPELAATTQFLVQGALQQWLADLITVDTVEVEAVEARITVRVIYTLRATGEVQDETFERRIGP
jgi:uncharacterized protein